MLLPVIFQLAQTHVLLVKGNAQIWYLKYTHSVPPQFATAVYHSNIWLSPGTC